MDLAENIVERFGDVPLRVLRAHLAEIADIADVIPFPILIDVLVAHLLSADRGNAVERLEDAARITAAAADIVDFAAARVAIERLDESGDVVRMDVVAHLLAKVAEHFVGALFQVAAHEITQKSVQFDAAMVRPGEATAAEAASLQAEISTVLLHHHVAGHFAGAEEAMLALIDGEVFFDAVGISGIVVIPTGRQLFQADRPNQTILVDCLTLWMSNLLMHTDPDLQVQECQKLLDVVGNLQSELILVSNETGLGVVPIGQISRRFVDETGRLHQQLGQIAHKVVFCVAGFPMILKGEQV